MNRTNEEEMKDKRIVVNSVVQVNENGQEKWIGCFVQVSEVKELGSTGMDTDTYARLCIYSSQVGADGLYR